MKPLAEVAKLERFARGGGGATPFHPLGGLGRRGDSDDLRPTGCRFSLLKQTRPTGSFTSRGEASIKPRELQRFPRLPPGGRRVVVLRPRQPHAPGPFMEAVRCSVERNRRCSHPKHDRGQCHPRIVVRRAGAGRGPPRHGIMVILCISLTWRGLAVERASKLTK